MLECDNGLRYPSLMLMLLKQFIKPPVMVLANHFNVYLFNYNEFENLNLKIAKTNIYNRKV